MNKNRIFSAFFLLISILSLFAWLPGTVAATDVEVRALHAFLADPTTGEILFEKDADTPTSPASLTKIMTALIAYEEADLSEYATVTQAALDELHPESSIAGLKVGEEMSLDDLLKCILIQSANDACNVLAIHLYGSIDAFVQRMNERATELGCSATKFANTHGLTMAGHYTTARDIYTITLEAMNFKAFTDVCNTASVIIAETNKSPERTFLNTNHLISMLKNPDYIYYYAKGIKTGHTSDAGYCLVSSAEKNGMFLISVVMKSEQDAQTGKTMSFVDTKELFEWGFANFKYQTMLSQKTTVGEITVRFSDSDYVSLAPDREISALLPIDFNIDDVILEKELFFEGVADAPINKGDVLGTLKVIYNGRTYGSVNLIALNSLKLDKILYYADQAKQFFAHRWIKNLLIGLISLIVLYAIFVIVYNSNRSRKNKNSNYGGRRR